MAIEGERFGSVEVEVALDFERLEREKRQELPKRMREVGRLGREEIAAAGVEWDRKYGGKSATDYAKKFVQSLKREFKATIGEARMALEEGLIDQKELERRAREAARATNHAIITEMKRTGGRADPGFATLAGGFVNVRQEVEGLERAAGAAHPKLHRLSWSLSSLLASAASVHPALGQIVNVLGSMAVGSFVMTGVLAGVALLVTGWRKITEGAREAEKATKDAIGRLEELRRQRALGPDGQLGEDAGKDALERARLMLERVRAEEFEAADAARRRQMVEAGGRPRHTTQIDQDIARIDDRLGVAWDEMAENQEERHKSARDREAAALASLVAANRANADEMARAREIMAEEYAAFKALADSDAQDALQRRQEHLGRARQLEGAFESAAAPGKREREKAQEEAEKASQKLDSLEDDLQKRLTALTATATDDLLLAIDKMEEEIYAAALQAGRAVSQGTIDGLQALRDDVEATRGLEAFQEQFRQMLRLDDRGAQQQALGELIPRLRQEAMALKEGSRARKAYLDLLEKVEDALKKNEEAIQREAKALARESAAEAARRRQEGLRDLRDRARLLEENARAALQLANALGAVSDETMAVLNNLAQLGGSVFRIAGGDLSAIPSAIGALAQLAKSAFGGRDTEELQRQLRENARMIHENTQALKDFREAALSGVSGTERQSMVDFWTSVIAGSPTSGWGAVVESKGALAGIDRLAGFSGKTREEIIEFLEKLERITGTEFFDLSKNTLDLDEMARAWEEFVSKGLGGFDETVGGALDAMLFRWQILGEGAGTAAEKLDDFLAVLAKFGKTGGFAEALAAALAEGGAEGANAFIDALAERFAAGDQTLFGEGGIFAGMSADEVRRLLEEGNTLIEEMMRGGSGGSTQDFVQARSITTIQASRIEGAMYTQNALMAEEVALSMEGNALLRAIVAGQGLSPSMVSGFMAGGASPSDYTPAPGPGSGGGVVLNIDRVVDGGIHVSGGSGSTLDAAAVETQVEAVFERAADRLAARVNRSLGKTYADRQRTLGRS